MATNSEHDNDLETSKRAGRHGAEPSGTNAGADMSSRMAGTHSETDTRSDTGAHVRTETTEGRYEERQRILPAKTSAAAVFALVFGLAALFCALTAILSPLAVLFGVIGIILAVAGMKMAKRSGVTGKGVALGGLITSVLGLLLGGAVLAGAAVLVNDEAQLDRVQNQIDDFREGLPTTQELENDIRN